MKPSVPTVFVIDDDFLILKALTRLFRSVDMEAAPFASPREFLDQFDPGAPGCLVLDLEMPGFGGIELQQELAALGSELPVIFLTGHGSIPASVQAMKQGAVDFLTKPVHDGDLLEAVRAALEKDRMNRRARNELAEIREKLALLTPREREVLLRRR